LFNFFALANFIGKFYSFELRGGIDHDKVSVLCSVSHPEYAKPCHM